MPRRITPVALAVVAGLALVLASCSSGSSSSAGSSTPSSGGSKAPGGSLGGSANTSTPVASLTGTGASSAQPFLDRVFYDYSRLNRNVSVDYSATSSGVGIASIQEGNVDFGQSEIPMSASDQAKATAGPVLQVPVDLGGVAISYDVPGAPKNLHLNGSQIADIYLGTTTDWHQVDSSIPAGTKIVPVHRADSSGTGYDLDQYLIDTSPTWVSAIGTTTASKTWPKSDIGVGEQLNSGVANYVKETPGAIGFIEYAYALQNGFTNASLLNASGAYVAPSISSIAAAGSHATDLSSSNFNIVNQPGSSTYPLANFSWTLIYQLQDADKGIALGKLFDWVATTGQRDAAALGYAPLPANARTLTHTTLLKLHNSSGTLLFSS